MGGVLVVFPAAAAEEARHPGAEQGAQGWRRTGDDGEVGLDGAERDGDAVVGVAVRQPGAVQCIRDGPEAVDGDGGDSGTRRLVGGLRAKIAGKRGKRRTLIPVQICR